MFSLQFLFIVAMVVQTFLQNTQVNKLGFLGVFIHEYGLYHIFAFVEHNLLSRQKATNLVASGLNSFLNCEWRL
jgi:hypothetical protein